ncbi:RNA 2',3'-cyclic phosphodiesterase [Mameliella alba]|nr:RNA 2',3'-cyclic phosphodiesterase [Mameliella alba]MBY6167839.1 RNA 2',3'-cyclic phosphodiesterase [Mameliella alba]MBY6172860.1 RNA 2',3'-cyclic phosphodiesterase [Mameliella alba]
MRLFVALPLPDQACASLEALQARFPVGRPVPYENLHLTLAFLGDQSEDSAELIHDSLLGLRAPAPLLTLAGAAVFGGRHGQAVGLEADGGAALTDLHARVMARLRGGGISVERRRFRPHVTLSRLRGHADAGPVLAVLAAAMVGPFDCAAFSLFASHLHPDGAIHEELARYPLTPTQ